MEKKLLLVTLTIVAVCAASFLLWLARSDGRSGHWHALTQAPVEVRSAGLEELAQSDVPRTTERVQLDAKSPSATDDLIPSSDLFSPTSHGATATLLGATCTVEWNGNNRFIDYESGERFAKGVFVQRRREGLHQSWWRNGQLRSSGWYVLGRREGTWQYFFESGGVRKEGPYTEGLKNGKWTTYHQNGAVASIGWHEKNSQEGEWLFYDEAGNLIEGESGWYDDGRLGERPGSP